jgi:ferredoxin
MAKRKIIEINRDLCDGCGLCTTACMEGALELDEENKAVLVKEIFCDGLGACLDVCPAGALKVVERESRAYDPTAACRHVMKTRGPAAAENVHGIEDGAVKRDRHHDQGIGGHRATAAASKKTSGRPLACGCPGSLAREIVKDEKEDSGLTVSGRSELGQWPIQLHLVSPAAPYFRNADLLIAADCTAFSFGSFHPDLLKGKRLVIACPKLDDATGYVEKLAEIFKINALKSLTVAIMKVPCCSGLFHMVEEAVALSGSPLEPKKVIIGMDGRIAG